MKRLPAATLATVLLAGLVVSCQVLLGVRDADFEIEDGGAGADGSDVEASSDGGPSCSAPLPPRPRAGEAGDGGGVTHVFAMKTIVFGGGPGAGFDLDRACTCASDDPEQARASCLPRGTTERCDLAGGVDNALHSITTGFAKESVARFNAGLDELVGCGRYTVLLVLQEYNGEPDDDDVLLFVAPSFGIRSPHDGGEPAGDDTRCLPTYPARWDGTDRWGSSLVGGDGFVSLPSFRGYVSGHRLVVDGRDQPSPGPISLVGFGASPMAVRNPIVMAQLESRAGGLELTEGVLAGRVLVSDALASFGGSVPKDGDGQRYCQKTEFGLVRTTFCQAADIMSAPTQDFLGERCDALSFVVSFTAASAGVDPGVEPIDPDVDAGPCSDTSISCP